MVSIKENHSTFNRWIPFWIGVPNRLVDLLMCVDMSALWRRHIIWSKPAGSSELRKALTQRFSSTTLVLSVIVAAEIGVMSSPAKPVDDVRLALKDEEYNLEFWTGVALAIATFLSIAALIANFTAWSVFAAVSDENLKVISRSSIGLYCAQLPNWLVVSASYLFFMWVCLFWYIITPTFAAMGLSVILAVILVYIVSMYSALGNLTMHSGALSDYRVVKELIEDDMTAPQITEELFRRQKKSNTDETLKSIYYRKKKMQGVSGSSYVISKRTLTIDENEDKSDSN